MSRKLGVRDREEVVCFLSYDKIRSTKEGGAWLRCDNTERTRNYFRNRRRRESGDSVKFEISTHRAPRRQPLFAGFPSVFAGTITTSTTAAYPRPPRVSPLSQSTTGRRNPCLPRSTNRRRSVVLFSYSSTPSALRQTSEPNSCPLSTSSNPSQPAGRVVLSARPPKCWPLTTFSPSLLCSPLLPHRSRLPSIEGSQLERRHMSIHVLDRFFVFRMVRRFDRLRWERCDLDACAVRHL